MSEQFHLLTVITQRDSTNSGITKFFIFFFFNGYLFFQRIRKALDRLDHSEPHHYLCLNKLETGGTLTGIEQSGPPFKHDPVIGWTALVCVSQLANEEFFFPSLLPQQQDQSVQ